MHWIIEDIFGDETQELIKHIESYQIIPYGANMFNKLTFDSNNLIRGSIDFVRRHRHPFLQPFSLLTIKNYDCTTYYSRMKDLLNEKCLFLPWSLLYDNKNMIFDCFPFAAQLFIRPNSGKKIFTGTTLSKKWWDKELDIIYSLPSSAIFPDTMVLVSDYKQLVREYRVLVHKNSIIDYSPYNIVEGCSAPQSDLPQIFQHVKNNTYFPDTIFTMDIGFLSNNKSKIIEINSFVSAGLYDMDYRRVVESVENILTSEFLTIK